MNMMNQTTEKPWETTPVPVSTLHIVMLSILNLLYKIHRLEWNGSLKYWYKAYCILYVVMQMSIIRDIWDNVMYSLAYYI